MTFLNKALLGSAAAAMALATASPAMARDHYRGYRHHDNDAAIAVGAGIIGLAIGAAIASDNHRDRYYDDRYYDGYGYYTPGYRTYYYPRAYTYYDNRWYNGYRYDRGWFYDRHGRRAYDRDGWHRHYGRRDRDWDDRGRRHYRHYRR